MNRYWRGTTKDGKFVTEAQGTKWDEVSDDLVSLELLIDDQIIKLPDNVKYIQAKTASADLGSSNATIESRYIGFKLGNNIVCIRVDEETTNISVEIS